MREFPGNGNPGKKRCSPSTKDHHSRFSRIFGYRWALGCPQISGISAGSRLPRSGNPGIQGRFSTQCLRNSRSCSHLAALNQTRDIPDFEGFQEFSLCLSLPSPSSLIPTISLCPIHFFPPPCFSKLEFAQDAATSSCRKRHVVPAWTQSNQSLTFIYFILFATGTIPVWELRVVFGLG